MWLGTWLGSRSLPLSAVSPPLPLAAVVQILGNWQFRCLGDVIDKSHRHGNQNTKTN